MENIDELFDNDKSFSLRTPAYTTNTPEHKKYSELIFKLESLSTQFTQEDFIWLKSNTRTFYFGYENNQFHYFMYCVDWSELYGSLNKKLTTYDILIKSNSEKKLKSIFQEAYYQIKKLFDGDITSSGDLTKCRDIVLNRISEGLNLIQASRESKSKGINEFFKMLFEKIGNVDYETADFTNPHLTGQFQRGRFIIDVYDKIIPAFEVSKKFNKSLYNYISGVEIDNFFAMHVLLRHTVAFKFRETYSPISESSPLILDGLGKKQKLTAHTDTDGVVKVISQDGVFYPPNFSCNQVDYFNYLKTGNKLKLDEIAANLFEKIKLLVPIFVDNINPEFSPNIIYHDNMLYGFEFPTWKYRKERTIELSSFYPLNSEYQLENGISKKDFDSITNKNSIPDIYKIKIENT